MRTPWPADQIEHRSIDTLTPYDRNARKHSKSQIKQVAQSIERWGWTIPILVDEGGMIIAGHCRVQAAKELGIENVPVMVAVGWSDSQKRAYVLADNQLTINATWDDEILRDEIASLMIEDDVDVASLGFDDDLIQSILNSASSSARPEDADPEEIPESPIKPVTRPGDIWVLGKHRLMCGDCTVDGQVTRLFAGSSEADLCLTDPPYGIGNTSSVKNNYDVHEDTRENLLRLIAGFIPLAVKRCKTIVLTPGNGNVRMYPEPAWTMAWFTPAGVGRGPWGFCCWQPILCYGKDPKLAKGLGCRPDAIVHTESSEKLGHPCTKPIKFWTWLMERTSEAGELIYDPFMGSGTTIIAAEQTGRTAIGMDLSPAYVHISLERWAKFTGQEPIHEATGLTFSEVKKRHATAE